MTTNFLNIKDSNLKYFFFIFYYLIFLSSFYIQEDSTGGAYNDYRGYKELIELFISDFKNTFLNFDQFGERHSPVIIILLSIPYKIGLSDEFIRFIFFNISIISIYFFYKCLKIKFKNVNSNYLILISLIFFLSPVFRSLSVWPDSRIIGFHFFIISVYFYLEYFESKKIVFCFLNVLFLAIASYFSINFCLFSVFFFIKFYNELIKQKKIFQYLILNFILAFPAFYYLFILDVFFLSSGYTPGSDIGNFGFENSLNFSNKILIIGSIIFFYLLPFVIYLREYFLLKKITLYETLIILIFSIINIYLFSYETVYTGGGIFFKISHYLFNSNILFFIISTYSLLIVYSVLIKDKKFSDLVLILILIFSNPQLSIYHKYYDPLLIFMFLTIFNLNIDKKYFSYLNISLLNIFYFIFLILNFLK